MLINEIGVLKWERSSYGLYECKNNGAFPLNKTFIINNGVNCYIVGEDVVRIKTFENGTPKDGLLYNTPIEIRVYD